MIKLNVFHSNFYWLLTTVTDVSNLFSGCDLLGGFKFALKINVQLFKMQADRAYH